MSGIHPQRTRQGYLGETLPFKPVSNVLLHDDGQTRFIGELRFRKVQGGMRIYVCVESTLSFHLSVGAVPERQRQNKVTREQERQRKRD